MTEDNQTPISIKKLVINRSSVGFILLSLTVLVYLVRRFFVADANAIKIIDFACLIFCLVSIFLIFPITEILFDTRDWIPNKTIKSLIMKIRLRAVLFNNLSVIIFVITILLIAFGIYYIIAERIDLKDAKGLESTSITIRISAIGLLIFLVQILFRVFKYLLRVAAFYNAKADALEYYSLNSTTDLSKLMEMFTPDKYDMSDLTNPAFFDKVPGK